MNMRRADFKPGLLWGLVMIMLAASSVDTPEAPAAAESRGKVDLSGRWLLTWTDGAHGPQQVEALFKSAASLARLRATGPQRYHRP